MGVPSLFRWLASRYPKMLANVIEELPTTVGEEEVPVDTTKPNPNQVEIDNLYLDMNGIIHPCCHPEDKAAPSSEEEMYIEIFKYIDRIFSMIRPRKVLFMAIDGVAPRAKMNQQRSRRFRAAREEAIKRAADERKKQELNLQGIETVEKEHFDSNCITPGTPFMEQLAISLRYYIVDRLNNNPGWKGVKVVLSDSSVPGEGEHKIMDFIRNQKIHSNYDPNTKHVLYGLDADLIMLALATHEPHFWILREDVTYKASMKACEICGQTGHNAYNCRGIAKQKLGEYDEKTKMIDNKPFVFVHISILREYLEAEMKLFDIPFDWDLERAIDDWVFMCFFIGNDFLPHLPSLEIREGAIDTLVGIWKQNTRRWKGYLTDSGDINLARVQDVLEDLGQVEDKVFQSRREQEERYRIQRLERKQKNRSDRPDLYKVQKREIDMLMERAIQDEEMGENGTTKVKIVKRKTDISSTGNEDVAKRLKLQLQSKLGKSKPADVMYSMDDFTDSSSKNPDELIIEEEMEEAGFVIPANGPATTAKSNLVLNLSETATPDESEALDSETIDTEIDSDEEAPPDNVRLWEGGWKQRYYENKFKVSEGDGEFRQKVVQSYVEGLCWVLKYYYQGVQSWKWFYPFHYAPFSSDFRNIQNLTIKFELSEPFKPIEQLLGVFPAASKQHIPKCFHFLMESDQSPVIDFYPEDFEIDMNGKKHEWQGVALLPFIGAERLLAAVQPLYKKLTRDEAHRNSTGESCLYLATGSKSFGQLCSIYSAKADEQMKLDSRKSLGLEGIIAKDPNVCMPGTDYISPLREFGLEDVENRRSVSALYRLPKLETNYKFKIKFLKGAQLPPRELRYGDFQQIRNDGEGTRGRHRSRRLPTITQFGLKLYGTAELERPQRWPSSNNNASKKARTMSENTMGGGGYSNRDYNGKLRPQGDSDRSNASSQRSINPYKQEPRQGGSGYRPNLSSHRDDFQQQSINPYRISIQQISNPIGFNHYQQIHEQSQAVNRFSRQPAVPTAPGASQKNSSSSVDSGDIDDLLNMLPSKK